MSENQSDYRRWIEDLARSNNAQTEVQELKVEVAVVEPTCQGASPLSPRQFAVEWLRDLLQEPRWVEDVRRLAAEKGIALRTLKRAKKSLGAKSVKMGGYFGGEDVRWRWQLD